ncbi:MAG: phosphoribosylamine--glycine ligase [Acidobacteriota bacterium]
MKVLLLGSGGREHALAWKIAQSPRLTALYTVPGNPGTARLGTNVDLSLGDLDGLVAFAREHAIDLTVVGPEAPLVAGIVDRFQQAGLRIAGPTQAAARLEASKAFTKQFLQQHGIPTADFEVFDDPEVAEEALRDGRFAFPAVVKADGLAAGKGVMICQDLEDAVDAVRRIMIERWFGDAGSRVVVEEFLRGEEASFMVFTDGVRVVPMVASQDHKAVYEGDQGPNTGGMGAYSVDSILTPQQQQWILDRIIRPTVDGMAEAGTPFRGVLYAGLMLTPSGPKVLEYNVRFGDPEAQAVLPRLRSDLLEVLSAVADGDLSGIHLDWSPEAAVCVVIASRGYPGKYPVGQEISGITMAEEDPRTTVFHAGTRLENGKLVVAGGRVLGVTATGPDLEAAIMNVYESVNRIHFPDMYYRRDIAAKGLKPA